MNDTYKSFDDLVSTLTDPERIRELHQQDQVLFSKEGSAEEPPEITRWLAQLRLLQGVPFHYLVSDPRMLPSESIRFFYVDEHWLKHLEAGALSVGRVSKTDQAHDQVFAEAVQLESQAMAASLRAEALGLSVDLETMDGSQPITGFLLRSIALPHWPGLEVKAFDKADELSIMRLELLAETVMLGLFSGNLNALQFNMPGEVLHFGIHLEEDQHKKYLRTKEGTMTKTKINVPMRSGNRRVLQVAHLVEAMKAEIETEDNDSPFTSAEYALQMVSGVEQVRFQKEK